MIHAYTRSECEEIARQISRATGITDYKLLFSDKEFKKTGVRIWMMIYHNSYLLW